MNSFPIRTVTLLLLLTLPAAAVPITITAENDNTGVSNVLLTSSTGALTVYGSVDGFIAEFTSAGGLLSAPSSGQARVEGANGNAPFQDLTFQLQDAVFTKAVLNANAEPTDGTLTFTVTYLLGPGSPFIHTANVDANGENYFTILAGGGAVITSVNLKTTGTSLADVRQVRIGGAAPAPNVPDSGSMLALLGLGLASLRLLALRRRT